MQRDEGPLRATQNERLMEIHLATEDATHSLHSQITRFSELQFICKGHTKTTRPIITQKAYIWACSYPQLSI